MLRQKTREEKQLWEALSGGSPIPLVVQPTGTGEEIRRIDYVLRREFWNMTWWRYPVAAFLIVSSVVLAIANIREALAGEFSENLPLLLIKISGMLFSGIMLLISVRPSIRWQNGVFTILELSKHASTSESARSLLYVARLDYFLVALDRETLASKLYERLTQVLVRLTDFILDRQEHQFLQKVALSLGRYPSSLRIAALLTLGDSPERLDPKFRARLEVMQAKENNEAVAAAARDVLSRK